MPFAPQQHRAAPPRARDAQRRPASQRGYDRDWKQLRERRLAEEPWCRRCEAAGIVVATNLIVDHVLPVHAFPDLRLEYDNTQTLCRSCHKRKTDEDLARYGAAR